MAIKPDSAKSGLQIETDPLTPWFVCLRLEGEHDAASAPRIRAETERALQERDLIFDLSSATFVDSSILRELVRARRFAAQHGRHVVLQASTAAVVQRALELVGMEKILMRAHDRQEAVDLLRALYLRR